VYPLLLPVSPYAWNGFSSRALRSRQKFGLLDKGTCSHRTKPTPTPPTMRSSADDLSHHMRATDRGSSTKCSGDVRCSKECRGRRRVRARDRQKEREKKFAESLSREGKNELLHSMSDQLTLRASLPKIIDSNSGSSASGLVRMKPEISWMQRTRDHLARPPRSDSLTISQLRIDVHDCGK
jgi:hypothetical protein